MAKARGKSERVTGLPFVCKQCGMCWGNGEGNVPGLIAVAGDMDRLSFANVAMSCPRCGTVTRPALPDGTYNIQQGRWELVRRLADDLRSTQARSGDYAKLISVLRDAQAAGKDTKGVADDIETETPFTRLAQTVREHPVALTGWLMAALLAIVLWRFPYHSETSPSESANPSPAPVIMPHLSDRELDDLAKQIARQLEERENLESRAPAPVAAQKGSQRNKPCPCGSKIKYKRCCGDPKRRPALG